MDYQWLIILKDVSSLIKDLGSMITINSNAKHKLLLSELKNNLRQFENAKKLNLPVDELIKILSNDRIVEARENGLLFSLIKFGNVQIKHIKDKRNLRYKGKNCEWLFENICDKIDELQRLQISKSLNQARELNIKLQLSNLYYKMKLLVQFINS